MIRITGLLTLLLPYLLGAQLQVRNYFGLTGKKDNAVKVISQDKQGYLVFSTTEGLFQFDGRTCSLLLDRHFEGEREITALFCDKLNHVWIGCRNGNIYCFDRKKTDSILPVRDQSLERITSFAETAGGILAGTYGSGILYITKETVRRFTISQGISDNVIYQLASNGQNLAWAGTDAGLTQLKISGNHVSVSTITSRQGLPDPIIRSIRTDGQLLLAGMQDSGVCIIDPAARKVERIPNSWNWNLGAVIHIQKTASGELYIGTEKDGLALIRQGQLTVYDYRNFIKTGKVNQMVADRENQLWVASERGLSHFIASRYFLQQSGASAEENKILALTVDAENAVWMGTPAGIGRMVGGSNGRSVIEMLPGLDKTIISCAAVAPSGDTWFGTYGSGILVHSKNTGKVQALTVKSGMITNDNVSFIHFEKNKAFISTLGGGIDVLALDNNNLPSALSANYSKQDGLGSDYVYAAITGTNGVLYAASDGGGVQELRDGHFSAVAGSEKLKSNTAFSLCRDPMGHIVATSNADGLLHYDGRMLKIYRLKEGLRDEQPAQIVASDNVLLCIHSKGLDKVNCADNSVTYYDLPDADFDPTLNAVVYKDGHIYSGTSNGLLTFRTSREADDTIRPLAQIREFFLNYKPFPIDSLTEYRWNQNSMAFGFGGIWLKDPQRLTFRYMLNGLEDVWQFSDQGKTVNYNNLNPGTYTFVVQVKNDEDVWSQPVQYTFKILTPVWKRWWFWLLVLAVLLAGLYLFVRFRLRALQRENLLLEKRVRERTHQIEKQAAIIEQKNVELERLSLVASQTDNVVLILDPEGNVEYINESFVRLNGFGLERIREEFGGNIYQLSNNPGIRDIIAEALRERHSVAYESLNNKAAGGDEIWESSTLTPIFDEAGELRKIIIIDTDVTLRKKQEQIIVQKNKDITDSIAYAKKIQHAILPDIRMMRQHVPELFVLYMTKDIVSGDFFWFGHYGDYSIIAAVDCTGHGVPGAFMSLIGYNQLNRIVNEEKKRDPSKILEELNKGVLGVLHKNDSSSRDGMDIAICRINHHNHTLEYAGAMRPLWTVKTTESGAELREVKADKIPIGTRPDDRAEEIRFHTRFLQLSPDETYYIFTDGYADQFGGAKNKKYSTGKFREFLCSINSQSVILQEASLRDEHLRWKGEHEQVDDILVIGFRA